MPQSVEDRPPALLGPNLEAAGEGLHQQEQNQGARRLLLRLLRPLSGARDPSEHEG